MSSQTIVLDCSVLAWIETCIFYAEDLEANNFVLSRVIELLEALEETGSPKREKQLRIILNLMKQTQSVVESRSEELQFKLRRSLEALEAG